MQSVSVLDPFAGQIASAPTPPHMGLDDEGAFGALLDAQAAEASSLRRSLPDDKAAPKDARRDADDCADTSVIPAQAGFPGDPAAVSPTSRREVTAAGDSAGSGDEVGRKSRATAHEPGANAVRGGSANGGSSGFPGASAAEHSGQTDAALEGIAGLRAGADVGQTDDVNPGAVNLGAVNSGDGRTDDGLAAAVAPPVPNSVPDGQLTVETGHLGKMIAPAGGTGPDNSDAAHTGSDAAEHDAQSAALRKADTPQSTAPVQTATASGTGLPWFQQRLSAADAGRGAFGADRDGPDAASVVEADGNATLSVRPPPSRTAHPAGGLSDTASMASTGAGAGSALAAGSGSFAGPEFGATDDAAQGLTAAGALLLSVQPGPGSAVFVGAPSVGLAFAPQHMLPETALAQIVGGFGADQDGPIEIALSPEELGRVRMTMTVEHGRMTVLITAERPETLEMLRRSTDMLARDLADAGHDNAAFSFSQDRASEGRNPHQGSGGPDERADATGTVQSDRVALFQGLRTGSATTDIRLAVMTGRLDLRI